MSAMSLLWAAIGAGIGVLHAAGLWRRAHQGTQAGWAGLWRLPLVGITLIIAALAGRLVPAALGWASGLALASVIVLMRQRRWM